MAPAGAAVAKLTTAPIERRERRPVTMSGFALLEDGSSHEILLLDLSYDGCGIEAPVALVPGQKVKLSVLRRGAIDAEVRWCAGGRAGLVFAPEEPSAEPIPRRSRRVSIEGEVTLRRLGQPNYRVRVFDVSLEGCKAEMVERPRIGEHVLIRFGGLEALQAEVCWVERHNAGLRFEKAFHPAVFDLLLERLRQG